MPNTDVLPIDQKRIEALDRAHQVIRNSHFRRYSSECYAAAIHAVYSDIRIEQDERKANNG